jgi:AFG3 family protein
MFLRSSFRSSFPFRWLSESNVPKGFEKFFKKPLPKIPGGTGSPGGANPGPLKTPSNPWFAIGAGAFGYLMLSSALKQRIPEITVQEFVADFLLKGQVSKVEIVNRNFARVYVRNEDPNLPHAGEVLRMNFGSLEQLEAKIDITQMQLGLAPDQFIPIHHVAETEPGSVVSTILPWVFMLLPLLFIRRAFKDIGKMMGDGKGGMGGGMGGGGRNAFNFGKVDMAGRDLKSSVKFTDVAGLRQSKQELLEFVDFLKHPGKYDKLGAKIPKGALLVGPPGTGKTLLAKAVAGEADVPFFSISGSDFVEMFVGVGASRVRDLFAKARKNAPSIIFIDEIDAVGKKRGKSQMGGNDERESTLNQLLVEMDGFSTSTGVVVLAGTNRVDILDKALTRAGRFDRQIPIDRPDLEEREEIFQCHLRNVTLKPGLDTKGVSHRMAALTPGMVGADIANICNEAAIFAARRKAEYVELIDFEQASERVIGGIAKSKNLMSPADKNSVAIHESGHAVAGWFLQYADPLLKVSIIPRSSGALGYAQYLPEEMSLYSKEALLDKMCAILGGRAAEEIMLNRITTGASDDFDKVTQMAYGMVQVYGMTDKVGIISFAPSRLSESAFKPFSEQTAQLIDSEVRSLIESQYERVKGLLSQHKEQLIALSESLFAKETIGYMDLKEILGPRPWPIAGAYEKFVDTSLVEQTMPKIDELREQEEPVLETAKI